MRYITLDQVLALSRCNDYPEARVRELFGTRRRVTVRTIATAPIPAENRLWLLIQCADARTQRLFACDCADRALARIASPDPRSIEAVRVARLYADGQATDAELAAARAAGAAWDAAGAAARAAGAAWDAAGAAARDAAGAAAGAAAWDARAAAWAAAWAAEIEWQVGHMASMM